MTLRDFLLGDIEVMNTFESASFSGIANLNLGKGDIGTKFKTKFYSSQILKAKTLVEDIAIDKKEFADFIGLFNSMKGKDVSFSAQSFPTRKAVDTVIKPKYINDYMDSAANIIDGVINGSVSKSDIDKWATKTVVDKVENQVVKTNLSIKTSDKFDFVIKDTNQKYTYDSINNTVIPFVNSLKSYKESILSEANEVYNTISAAEDKLNKYIDVANDMMTSMDKDIAKKVSYAMYHVCKSTIEIISYVSCAEIIKLNDFTGKAYAVDSIYRNLSNVASISESANGEESVNATGVVNNDIADIANNLLLGNTAAFDVYANRIAEFHAGLLKDGDAPNEEDGIDNTSEVRNNEDVYDDIVRANIEIGQSLDHIVSLTSDFIFDPEDAINDSGFLMSLEDKYVNAIKRIDDLSDYNESELSDVNGGSINLYKRVLSEISKYPENMRNIAKAISSNKIRIDNLIKKFEYSTSPNENLYKNTEAVKDIREWLSHFKDDYIKFVETIASKYMARLHNLSNIADTINNTVDEPVQQVANDTASFDDISSTDYTESVYDAMYDSIVKDFMESFENLQKEYYQEREDNLTGRTIVYEADEAQKEVKPTVVDNSGENSKASGGEGIVEKFINWLSKTIESFTNGAKRASENEKAKNVINSEDALASRSYNNVSANLPSYKDLPFGDILKDFTVVGGNISKLTPAEWQAGNTEEYYYTKLFPFITGLKKDDKVPFEQQVKNWYKYGNVKEPMSVKIENGMLKTKMGQSIIPYIKLWKGWNALPDQINKAGSSIKDAFAVAENKIKGNTNTNAVQTESATEDIVSEADANAVADTAKDAANEMKNVAANTVTSMTSNLNIALNLSMKYVGAVLNSQRDRFQDYINLASMLIPKAK